MPEPDKRPSHLAWAYCPNCKSAIGQLDAKCPNCGYDFPPPPPPPDPDAITYQFDLRFLFYLMALTAIVCSVCRMLGQDAWLLAGPMFLTGLLIWRTRREPYAAIPGLLIAFLIGALFSSSVDALGTIVGGLMLATMIGCPLNAWLKGFPRSGCLAFLLSLLTFYLAAWLLVRH
jgi:hypothetical protein